MTQNEDVERNYEWFKKQLHELVQKYDGKYVVIKNEILLGVYDTFSEAWETTLRTEKAGTFIIQLCSLDEEKTSYKFYTNRVSFD